MTSTSAPAVSPFATTVDFDARTRTETRLVARPQRDLGAVTNGKMIREITGQAPAHVPAQASLVDLLQVVTVTPIKADGTRNPNIEVTVTETVLLTVTVEEIPNLVRVLSTALISSLEMP